MKSDPNGMTIDELARRTRATTRTLRLYQTKALLPPPRIVGRVGYYTEMHVNRLLLIERLQKRGFSLAGIAELFKVWESGKGLDELFGFEAKLVQPWNEEEAEELTTQEFEAQWPDVAHDGELMKKVIELGVVEKMADGTFRVISPMLLEFGRELVLKGVPVSTVISEFSALRDDARRIAQRFTGIFRQYMLPNMIQGGFTEWLPRLANYSVHMRPTVRSVLLSIFTRAMDDEIQGLATSSDLPLEDEELRESDEPSDPSEPPLKSAAGGH